MCKLTQAQYLNTTAADVEVTPANCKYDNFKVKPMQPLGAAITSAAVSYAPELQWTLSKYSLGRPGVCAPTLAPATWTKASPWPEVAGVVTGGEVTGLVAYRVDVTSPCTGALNASNCNFTRVDYDLTAAFTISNPNAPAVSLAGLEFTLPFAPSDAPKCYVGMPGFKDAGCEYKGRVVFADAGHDTCFDQFQTVSGAGSLNLELYCTGLADKPSGELRYEVSLVV